MEQNFASAYVLAFERQKQISDGTFVPLRRKRAAQVQDTIVTVCNYFFESNFDLHFEYALQLPVISGGGGGLQRKHFGNFFYQEKLSIMTLHNLMFRSLYCLE